MILAIETTVLCILFFAICFIGTGSDIKNLNSFDSYPRELREKLATDEKLKDKIKKRNPIVTFISNFIMFLVILFLLGIAIRSEVYLNNFVALMIIGQTLNIFDLVVIDLLYFIHSKRTKFSDYPDKDLYLDPREHIYSFLKALLMFTLVSAIDASLLILF